MNMLFGRKPRPAHVVGDRVEPLHFFDSNRFVQRTNVAVSIVFNDVLDPKKLRESLESVVKREGWQRLGGRLRKNASGEIEWHIPAEFTTERPAIAFTHVDHDMPAAHYLIASEILRPSTRPSIVGDLDELVDLAWEPGYKPRAMDDYLISDRPVLGLRVNSFTDRSIVTLQWQHVAFDALGMQYVLEAWNSMLWGKADEIPTPCGLFADPFDALAQGSRAVTEQHILSDRVATRCGMLQWVLRYGVDTFVRAKENRMICVPETYWRVHFDKALEELRAEATERGEDAEKVFLTENDILTAWIIRCNAISMNMNSDKTVATSIAMSLRKAFEGDLISPSSEHPYVGNAFGWANVLVTAGDIYSKPLSWLARQVRRAINEQGTRTQHEVYYEMLRTSHSGLPVVLFGEGTMAQLVFTNWSKAGLFNLDFAPARKVSKGNVPCRPSYVQEHHGPIKFANAWVILGKDDEGNYWTSACRVKGQWAKFQKQLDKDFREA